MDLLNETEIDIADPPLAAYGEDDGEDVDDDGEDVEVDDDDNEVVEVAAAEVGAKKRRVVNYTEIEDTTLCRAWAQVGIDAVSGTDQTGKRYWQRIEDRFFQLMPQVRQPVYRS